MSMSEQMARWLAQEALNRLSPGIYTNVVDEIWVYQTVGGKFKVSDCPGDGTDEAPEMDYETASETMVAMMAEQAGAMVVVPEEAPMDSHLAQIAQLLVDSADVPTDAQDVADGAAIVGTVKRALAYLAKADGDNNAKRATILEMGKHLNAINAMLDKSPDIAITEDDLQVWSQTVDGVRKTLRYLGEVRREAIELRKQVDMWKADAKRAAEDTARSLREAAEERDRIGEQYYNAQQEIGALTAKLEVSARKNDRYAVELGESLARYDGLQDALRMALDKLAKVSE